MTDRQTDRQTERRTPGENNMSPDPEGGTHKYQYLTKAVLNFKEAL